MTTPLKPGPKPPKKSDQLKHRWNQVRKTIGLLNKHGKEGLHGLAENMPFLIVDEAAVAAKTAEELAEDLKQTSRALEDAYLLERSLEQQGVAGLKNLHDLATTRLQALGVDPHG